MLNPSDDFLDQIFASQGQGVEQPLTDFIPDPEDDDNVPPALDDDADDAPPTPQDDVDEDSDPVIENYVKFLQENDLIDIPEEYDFKGKPDQLKEVFEHTKKARKEKVVAEVFEQLPEDFKPLFDYALKGGSSIEEYMRTFSNDLADLSLDTEEGQKKILFQYYKETSPYSDEKIQRLISHFNDEDELRIEAEDAFNDLTKIRNERKAELLARTERQQEEYRQELERKTVELNRAIEETSAIHPQRKNKVKAFFFEPLKVDESVTTGFNATINSILSNPEHQAQLADILLDYSADKGFSTDRPERRVKSKATQDFKSYIKTKLDPKQAQRSSTSRAPETTSFNWDEYTQSL
jgi:hypothetical protein